jgi:hypothetical protein
VKGCWTVSSDKQLNASSKPRKRILDPGTLQFDWFIGTDNTECEIHETYDSSEAFLAHLFNLRELLRILYEKFASDHSVIIYGDPSPELLTKIKARGVDTKYFSLLQGL